MAEDFISLLKQAGADCVAVADAFRAYFGSAHSPVGNPKELASIADSIRAHCETAPDPTLLSAAALRIGVVYRVLASVQNTLTKEPARRQSLEHVIVEAAAEVDATVCLVSDLLVEQNARELLNHVRVAGALIAANRAAGGLQQALVRAMDLGCSERCRSAIAGQLQILAVAGDFIATLISQDMALRNTKEVVSHLGVLGA